MIFRITETREATLVHDILNGYGGVLISDFYGGYDSCNCRQQKCLVHLIRDLNEDLWKNPYNLEFENFVTAFKDLLVTMMADVDNYGLKKRHLHKHKSGVDRFYQMVIHGKPSSCETTEKYRKRFIRYKDSLFLFLDVDGIPWNNNMGERAIRHLAVQRKISGTFYKKAVPHFLCLLGIAQTCRFQEKSFLDFMVSGQRDIDEFKPCRHSKASKPSASTKKSPAPLAQT